ncbi:SDR family NAD(P)-dependent oxidoreductase [Dyadobacter fanqingshengii]|uniref:SDR family NAD(P)-dependent oxidoreductase n=1 Tax=Dyadobacter fanqingshengii TaxID=2906443 RepID=UPI0035B6030B
MQNQYFSPATKSAVVIWSEQLSSQLGPFSIRVNCLQPGLIDTKNEQLPFGIVQSD